MPAPKEGFAARAQAVDVLEDVLRHGKSLDDALSGERGLDPRDQSFVAAIVLASLRHLEAIDQVLAQFLARPLPKASGTAKSILRSAVAQLLYLESPAYAVIDVAVTLARRDRNAKHFSGLVNAVLRKVAAEGKPLLDGIAPQLAPWLMRRWTAAHGAARAGAMAAASLNQAPLDISVKADAAVWAERLGGVLLPTGTVRLAQPSAAVENLAGYEDGQWWVQDAASAIPARILGDIAGRQVADLCAAPGGKTLQLASGGARVTAVDASAKRLERLQDNLRRTQLAAEIVVSDVLNFSPRHAFDAVLLDAPCSATGTIRRHPDLPYRKSAQQIGELVTLQRKLLTRASAFVKPGGLLVYCTCSLEPEEGEGQLSRFLGKHPEFKIEPVVAGDCGIAGHFLTPDGCFRSFPDQKIGPSQGLDGFFAARLRRR